MGSRRMTISTEKFSAILDSMLLASARHWNVDAEYGVEMFRCVLLTHVPRFHIFTMDETSWWPTVEDQPTTSSVTEASRGTEWGTPTARVRDGLMERTGQSVQRIPATHPRCWIFLMVKEKPWCTEPSTSIAATQEHRWREETLLLALDDCGMELFLLATLSQISPSWSCWCREVQLRMSKLEMLSRHPVSLVEETLSLKLVFFLMMNLTAPPPRPSESSPATSPS